MKEIVRRLMENHTDVDVTDKEILNESEEVEGNSEEELNEDWRDGKFEEKDLDKYIRGIKEDVVRVAYSFSQMKKKHPEYENELNKALSDIRNVFANLR